MVWIERRPCSRVMTAAAVATSAIRGVENEVERATIATTVYGVYSNPSRSLRGMPRGTTRASDLAFSVAAPRHISLLATSQTSLCVLYLFSVCIVLFALRYILSHSTAPD